MLVISLVVGASQSELIGHWRRSGAEAHQAGQLADRPRGQGSSKLCGKSLRKASRS